MCVDLCGLAWRHGIVSWHFMSAPPRVASNTKYVAIRIYETRGHVLGGHFCDGMDSMRMVCLPRGRGRICSEVKWRCPWRTQRACSSDSPPRCAKVLDGVSPLGRANPGGARVRRPDEAVERLGHVPRDEEGGNIVPAVGLRRVKAYLCSSLI